MNLYETLFLLQLIVLLGITFAKLYNIFNVGKFYDLKMGFILFIAYLLFGAFGFVVSLLAPSELLYIQLYKISIWGGSLQIAFLLIEIFFSVRDSLEKPIEALGTQKD